MYVFYKEKKKTSCLLKEITLLCFTVSHKQKQQLDKNQKKQKTKRNTYVLNKTTNSIRKKSQQKKKTLAIRL